MTDVSNPTSTPAPAPTPSAPAALPPHIAALSPADQATALASLVKAGRPLPAAAPAPAQPSAPAGEFVPTAAFKTNEAMALWDRLDKSDPARVERFRQAMIADTGVDPQALTQTPEQKAYLVPAQPQGYDLHLDPSVTTSDPAAQAEYEQSFSAMAHNLQLPQPIAAALASDILDAATRFQELPEDERSAYFASAEEGGGLPFNVKQEIARSFNVGSWDQAKPLVQEALKPVWQRMSADDKAELFSSGALNSYPVVARLITHGRVLNMRAADKGPQQ